MAQLSKAVINRIDRLGFTAPFIADLDQTDDAAAKGLSEYIANNHHGTMAWIEETAARRGHPKSLWPEARSAVVLGMNYGPETDPLITLSQAEKATISVYARGRDYHDVMKGRLKEIAGLIARDTGEDVKIFVDTAPLMEKPLAQQAGLGWQGKHTNLVSRDYGSWLFLGTILTAAVLSPTKSEIDHCGNCRACLDICPTNAFPAPYKLDARRCISYLTIEHSGPVAEGLREKMGNRIYGCDDCLAICPWNKFAKDASEMKLKAKDELNAPELAKLAALGETGFRQTFSGSPIKRIGWHKFLRNVLYAIGNSGMPSLLGAAKNFTDHPDPVVADAASWAAAKIEANS